MHSHIIQGARSDLAIIGTSHGDLINAAVANCIGRGLRRHAHPGRDTQPRNHSVLWPECEAVVVAGTAMFISLARRSAWRIVLILFACRVWIFRRMYAGGPASSSALTCAVRPTKMRLSSFLALESITYTLSHQMSFPCHLRDVDLQAHRH